MDPGFDAGGPLLNQEIRESRGAASRPWVERLDVVFKVLK